MQQRKHQFFSFIVILLSIGFLNYFRRIANGYKLTKHGKILYLITMIMFVSSAMLVLYVSELSNITSFLIGLGVTVLSEHLAKFFIVVGDSFNPICIKIIKFIFKIDLTKELTEKDKNQLAFESDRNKRKLKDIKKKSNKNKKSIETKSDNIINKSNKDNIQNKVHLKPIILRYIMQRKNKQNKK